jgi:hypothetical protein
MATLFFDASPRLQFTLENAPAREKREEIWLGPLGQDVGFAGFKKQQEDFLKMQQQSENVYENKGSGFRSAAQTGNARENKDTYEF